MPISVDRQRGSTDPAFSSAMTGPWWPRSVFSQRQRCETRLSCHATFQESWFPRSCGAGFRQCIREVPSTSPPCVQLWPLGSPRSLCWPPVPKSWSSLRTGVLLILPRQSLCPVAWAKLLHKMWCQAQGLTVRGQCSRRRILTMECKDLSSLWTQLQMKSWEKPKHCQWLRRVTPKLWKMQLLHQVSSQRFWASPNVAHPLQIVCRPTSNQMSFPKVLCLCLRNSGSQVGRRCLPIFHLWRQPSASLTYQRQSLPRRSRSRRWDVFSLSAELGTSSLWIVCQGQGAALQPTIHLLPLALFHPTRPGQLASIPMIQGRPQLRCWAPSPSLRVVPWKSLVASL